VFGVGIIQNFGVFCLVDNFDSACWILRPLWGFADFCVVLGF